jgi:GT2 family glycosyltransferase
MTNISVAVLYRKSALEVTKEFDADYWSDWEDYDLSCRLWLAGYKNLYTTKTTVFHVGGGSLGKGLSKERYVRIIRNMLFTYFKNYEPHNLATRFLFFMFAVLPFRHTISIMAYELKRLREGSSKKETYLSRQVYLSLPQAYLQFLRGLRMTMRKRLAVQRTRKVSDSAIFTLTERKWIV